PRWTPNAGSTSRPRPADATLGARSRAMLFGSPARASPASGLLTKAAMHTIRFHDAIAELPAAAWDALRGEANPFVSHAFLRALEDTGCIRPDWGWQAHHLGLY